MRGKNESVISTHQRSGAWILPFPLVFSTAGGIGPTASVVYKRIPSMLAQKYASLQQDTSVDSLQTELLTAAFSNNVPERSMLKYPSSGNFMDLAC